jgi:formamidopyrimidine-DNA glycosylase
VVIELRGPLLRACCGLIPALQLSVPSRGRESLAHGFSRSQSTTIGHAVPELPDLTVVAEALDAALRGRSITAAQAPGPLAVRGTPDELAVLSGQRVMTIRRRGKFLLLDLDRDRVVVNPMLTGRFQLAADARVKPPTKTAVVLSFGPRDAIARPRPPFAAWTRGASWLPSDGAQPEVRYRDPTQMGKVYLLPARVERTVPGLAPDEIGPDVDDPTLTLEVWRERIRRHPGELKNLLRNQAFVAGVGNAYSDEILHAARLLPFRMRSSLAPEEIDSLYVAARTTLADAIEVLRRRVPPTFETQVRDFLAVHLQGGRPCPRCGTRITEVKAGGFVTSYCRGCQR